MPLSSLKAAETDERVLWTRIEDSLDVVAHISEPVPRYWLVDSPALEQFLTNELTYGLQVAIEAAVLATINATSGIMVQAYATSVLAVLRKSLTTIETQGYEPGFLLLNPSIGRASSLRLLRRTLSSTLRCRMTVRVDACSVCQSSCRTRKLSECHTLSAAARSHSKPTLQACKSHGQKRATRQTGLPT